MISVSLKLKSLLQNPNMRSGREVDNFNLFVKAPRQIIHSSAFMFLELKAKRWSKKWGINQPSCKCLRLPTRSDPFYHNLGAETCSYENYSSTSCGRVVTQKQWDSLQVAPSFTLCGEIAYWLQSVCVCERVFPVSEQLASFWWGANGELERGRGGQWRAPPAAHRIWAD